MHVAEILPHDDVMKWKHFPPYWAFVRKIHRSPVNSPHKVPWRGALMFSLICALNKRLNKQSWGRWFETPSRSLWRHCNVIRMRDPFILQSQHHRRWFPSSNKQGKSEGFESCDRPIVRKRPIWVKIGDVLYRVTLKFYGWPWKTIGHLSFAVSSFVQHFIAIGEFKMELQSVNAPIWVKFDNF